MNDSLAEYRELLPICRKLVAVRRKLRVRAHCGYPEQTHAHCDGRDRQFGRICISIQDLGLSYDGKAATLIHECLHFKGMLNHTKRFWKEQSRFFSHDRWLELAYSDEVIIKVGDN
jgi:hypothetical protein